MRSGVLRADFREGCSHAVFPDFFGGRLPAGEVQELQFRAKMSNGDTRVQKGAEGHITADAAETVEIGAFHGLKPDSILSANISASQTGCQTARLGRRPLQRQEQRKDGTIYCAPTF